MSNPPPCGRVTPRWSNDNEVAGSALSAAALVARIAIVGVLPGLFSCRDNNCGSLVVTTPGHGEKKLDPEPLFMIKLPAPTAFTKPATKKHSLAPLLAIMLLDRMNLTGWRMDHVTTMAPPEPVLWLPLNVEFSTCRMLSTEKIAPPASAPLSADPPPPTPRVTKL